MECAACQAAIRPRAKFCSACGAPVALVCAACGSANPPAARFCSECGVPLGEAQPAVVRTPAAPPSAERRQLSVLFCDLAGSTELSSRLDPEDLGALTRDYQGLVADAMMRFGGFVAKYMGDGVLVYFGWPRATEADPEQALRAALAAAEAVSAAPVRGERLRVRIGVATGLVVVGDRLDAGEGQEQTAIGETPNRAARLQALAEPGGIVIDAATRRLVGDLFDLRAMGNAVLKGLPEPVEVFELGRERQSESRFDALRAASLTPLVGREEELDLLLRRWGQARDGPGRVVLVSGEPGIGKSRLLAELNERLIGENFIRLRYFCSPHTVDTPLHPVIRQLESAAGFERDDPPAARAAKLRALLAAVDASDDNVALITALLHLPEDGLPVLNLSPQRRKELTFAALMHQVERLSARRPLLMLFEDMHWADPSTRELLDDSIRRMGALRVLLVMTFRPEFIAPWLGHAGVTSITLTRLERNEAAALAAQLAARLALPGALLDRIVAQSDGVPLFIEELTKAVVESPPQGDSVSVPATLQASLLARLDRMPVARHVAQIGSVIGRDFSRELLSIVGESPASVLDQGLDQLVVAGLLFRHGEGEEASYTFKHALIQDTAYSTLLRGRRQQLHGRTAASLEDRFPELVDAQPGLLAHHFTRAGDAERAAEYLLRAGQQALRRGANVEAEQLLRQGLARLASLAQSEQRRGLELDLQLALGHALCVTRGFGAPEVGETHRHARAIADQLGRNDAFLPILYNQWVHHLSRTEMADVERCVEEIAQLETGKANIVVAFTACRVRGFTALWLGDFETARTQLERGLDLYDPAQHHAHAEMTPTDPLVFLLTYLGQTLAFTGYVEQARANCDAALTEARRSARAHSLSIALASLCISAWVMHCEPKKLLQYAEELAMVSAQEAPNYYPVGLYFKAVALSLLGQHEESVPLFTAVSEKFQSGENKLVLGFPMKADACRLAGKMDAALTVLAEAESFAETTRLRKFQAETQRLKGEVQLDLGNNEGAEDSYGKAIALARAQGAKLFELRASVSLARLWRDNARKAEARDLLAPIYGWFTEGFDAPDLIEARTLLDELGADRAG